VERAESAIENGEYPDTGGQAPCRSARIAAGVQPPERFIHASFVERNKWTKDREKMQSGLKLSNCSKNWRPYNQSVLIR
jgi:hypothetical protein